MKPRKFGIVEQLPSGRWRARYPLNGKRVSAPFTFATDILGGQWLDEQEKLVKQPGVEHLDLGPMSTFNEWADLFLNMPRRVEKQIGNALTKKKSAATIRDYETVLRLHCRPFLGELRLANIDYPTVLAFLDGLTDSLEEHPVTMRKAYNYATWVIGLAIRLRVITYNPFNDPRLTKPDGTVRRDPIEIDEDDVDRLVACMDPFFRRAVYINAYTGFRAGELWAIQLRHLNPILKEVLIEQALKETKGEGMTVGPTKNGLSRRVALTDKAWQAVEEQIATLENRSPDAFLFLSERGKLMRHTNFMRRSWSDACTAAEMPEGLRFHDLRHFCAHFHIGLGFDLYAIKDMLGHSSIKVTADIYGGRFNSVRKAMADAVSRHQAERDLRIQEATGLPSISPISGSENGVILPFVPRSYHAAETGKG